MSDLVQVMDDHVEGRAHEAHALSTGIKGTVGQMRRLWAELARYLYEFQRIKGWESLGYDSQQAYLADPEIGLSRTHALRLVQGYRELVIERGVTVERLGAVESSKVWEVLPAVRRGQVDVERALADCEALAALDLRERYAALPAVPGRDDERPIEPDSWHYESCPHCGSRMRVRDRD